MIKISQMTSNSSSVEPSKTANKKKKKKKRLGKSDGKLDHESDGTILKTDEITQTESDLSGRGHDIPVDGSQGASKTPNQKSEDASSILAHLALLVNVDYSNIPPTSNEAYDLNGLEKWSALKTLQILFEGQTQSLVENPLWLKFDDKITSPILDATMFTDTRDWIQANASQLVILFSERSRRKDLTSLLQVGVAISCKALTKMLSNLQKGRGNQFNNKSVKLLCANCEIYMDSRNEFGRAIQTASHVISKSTKKDLVDALKKTSAQLNRTKSQHTREKKVEASTPISPPIKNPVENDQDKADVVENTARIKLTVANEKIQAALNWYKELLHDLVTRASAIKNGGLLHLELSSLEVPAEKEHIEKPRVVLTSE